MNVKGNVMTLDHFVDFYYLEALRANLSMAKSANPENQFRHSFERLENDVNEAFDHLAKTMAHRIYIYLWGASLVEAQYANDECECRIPELDGVNYRDAFNYFPTEHNVQMVKDVYAQEWNDSGYGGEAWLQIVEGMELYGKITDAAFVDHCVDLEHNGGCAFNKTGASPFLLDCYSGDIHLHYFLDHKFSADLLQSERYHNVSRKVYNLIVRFSNIVKPAGCLEHMTPSLEWLTDYSVEWNDGAFENEFSWDSAEGRMSCYSCGCKITSDESFMIDDEYFCENCVEKCDNCGEWVVDDDTEYIDGEKETWCNDCVSNYKETCEECNYDYHTKNMGSTEDDCILCEDCMAKSKCEYCEEHHHCDMDEHLESHKDDIAEAKQEECRKKQGICQLKLLEV